MPDLPSPNDQLYEAMVPNWTVDADASNVEAVPTCPTAAVNRGTGDWSGVIAIPFGPVGQPKWRVRDGEAGATIDGGPVAFEVIPTTSRSVSVSS